MQLFNEHVVCPFERRIVRTTSVGAATLVVLRGSTRLRADINVCAGATLIVPDGSPQGPRNTVGAERLAMKMAADPDVYLNVVDLDEAAHLRVLVVETTVTIVLVEARAFCYGCEI